MVFRGIFVDGKIIPGSDLGLPDGSPVEFRIVGKPRRRTSMRSKGPVPSATRGKESVAKRRRSPATARLLATHGQRRLSVEQRVAIILKAAGGWASRPEWKGRSSADIAAELRRRLARRATHG